jgi:hypothetical protein
MDQAFGNAATHHFRSFGKAVTLAAAPKDSEGSPLRDDQKGVVPMAAMTGRS